MLPGIDKQAVARRLAIEMSPLATDYRSGCRAGLRSPGRCGRAAIAGLLLTVWTGTATSTPAGASTSPLCAAFIQRTEQVWEGRAAKKQPLTPALKMQIHKRAAAQVERQLCDQPYFAARNRLYVTESRKLTAQLTSAYRALLNRLDGAARAHLAWDEARWAAYHDREDTNPENVIVIPRSHP